MSDQQYKIVFEGRTADGVEEATARANVQSLFRIPEARINQLFSGQPVVMKSGINRVQAEKYVSRLREAGVIAEMIPMTTRAPVSSGQPPRPPVNRADQASEPDGTEIHTSGFRFHGTGKEYFGIWIVNILLTVVTLGIYSAWAKVRNNQYFYGNTELEGASFQYLASPIAILKGRIVAFVALVIYTLITELFPIAGLLLVLLLLIAMPWMVVRGLKFHAINSAYRNIRFDFQGTYGQAFMVLFVWPVLTLFTLGLLAPMAARRMHKFMVENARYGTAAFSWTGTDGTYYRFFGKALLLILAFGVGAAVAGGVIHPILTFLVMTAGYLALFGYFQAGMTNLLMNHAELQSHGFGSELAPGRMVWLIVSNSILTALTLGLFIPWAKVRLASYRASQTHMAIHGNLDNFVAAEAQHTNALGDEMGEAFDVGSFLPV
ncbi:YjgN family protein [Marinobacter sp. M1N3S26]|uniref:YjgN family protein n=1 Tax=Marinobacter sp. M1N3S26 TaxID=3382299 RepID=UPI00387B080B